MVQVQPVNHCHNEWAMVESIRNPNIMKKAQVKLDEVIGKSWTVEDAYIPNLKYLQAITKEIFRLHAILPLMFCHMSENACKVLGYDILEETPIFINITSIGWDPSICKDLMVPKAERFVHKMHDGNINCEGKHFELLPFGLG